MYPSSYWRQRERDLDFGTYAHQHQQHYSSSSNSKNNLASGSKRDHSAGKKQPLTRTPLTPAQTTYETFTTQNYKSHSYFEPVQAQVTPRPTDYSTHRLKPIGSQQRPRQEEHDMYRHHQQQLQSLRGQRLKEAMRNEYLEREPQRHYRQNDHVQHPDHSEEVDVIQEAERQHEHYSHKLYGSHRLVVPRPSISPNLRNPELEKVQYQDGFEPSTHWGNTAATAMSTGDKDIEYEDEEVLSHESENSGTSKTPSQSTNEREQTAEEEDPEIITIDDMSVDGGRGGKPHQQEVIIDPEYLNQRYAANVQPIVQPVQPVANSGTNASLYYDDTYYVYDDENKEPQYDDVDYKSSGGDTQREIVTIQTTTTTTTTRRPVPAPTPKPSRGSSRGSARHKSSSSGRPTLKPSSSIVKDVQDSVRDVYVDAPSRPLNVYETPVPNTPASKCRKDECVLPDCNCGGKDIPGGLPASSVPQIVLLTFDDSVNDLNKDLYRDLFEKGRKNPNGCPISATFYVSHEWTDYSQVQNLAADGHEIASHSVSHSFGEQFSQKKWDREIGGQREILAAYGGVKLSEIRGMRAPFLAIGGNNMFKMLHDSNFTYDSSMPIYENRPPSWPYTLDYRIFHDCMIPPCPTKSYPGVWEVPMVMWQDLKGGRCSMGDACSNPPTAEGVYNMLAKNFERHYTTNRAPFGLYYHAAWFTQPHHKEGFEAFLDTLVNMDDVWLVTNWQAIQWVRDPTPLNQILNFEPWSCHNNRDRPRRCNNPKVCNLWHKSGVRYMKTCQQCPSQYPWVGSTGIPNSNSL